jgi:PAS domain S-box-containing protein
VNGENVLLRDGCYLLNPQAYTSFLIGRWTTRMMTGHLNGTAPPDERWYRHLFEHMPICILIADVTEVPMTILEANRRAELVYGFAADELVGMPAAQLVPEDARPAILAVLRRVAQGETVTAETVSRRRDGTRFPVRWILTSDPGDQGHLIILVADISTENKRRSEMEAIDAERLRIAHEIHDGVVQSLAGLRFKSALWSHLADAAPPDMHAALDELQAVLAAAIDDLRRAIFALRPVDLEALGFFPALAQLVCDFGDQNRVAAGLEIVGPQETLPAAYELALFRMVQESLNNIGRHAGASQALVCLDLGPSGSVAVSVRDNGRGFDPGRLGPAVAGRGHFGLRQMRERIVDLGGTLDIHSAPGQGTELAIALPALADDIRTDRNGEPFRAGR